MHYTSEGDCEYWQLNLTSSGEVTPAVTAVSSNSLSQQRMDVSSPAACLTFIFTDGFCWASSLFLGVSQQWTQHSAGPGAAVQFRIKCLTWHFVYNAQKVKVNYLKETSWNFTSIVQLQRNISWGSCIVLKCARGPEVEEVLRS